MRSLLPRVALALASFWLTFVSAEIVLRKLDGVPITDPTNFVSATLRRNLLGNPLVRHHPVLGWAMRENVQGTHGAVTTGAYGVRMNSTRIRELPAHAILAVGDSFVAGSEVADDESWPAQLERELGEPVVNAGTGAWGVDQIVLRAEELLPVLSPHTLIIGILTEDTLRNNYVLYGGGYKPYFDVVGGELKLRGTPVPAVVKGPRDLGLLRASLGRSYLLYSSALRLDLLERWAEDSRRYRKVHEDRVGLQISCLLMRRLAELKRRLGIRVIVLLQYGGSQILEKERLWYASPVIDCAKRSGLEALDTYEALHEIAERDISAFRKLFVMHDHGRVYGHMSAHGNAFMAALLKQDFFSGGFSFASPADYQ
ncbi:MAG: SGNH/GDSL hydrolase family protein [Myxococcota bacterium]